MKPATDGSVFGQCFDVGIVGTGYAGYAAAGQLHAQGKRVLLLDRGCDLLWESGRAMMQQAGSSADAGWQQWTGQLASIGGYDGQRIDPAIAELLASSQLLHGSRDGRLGVLYGAAPVAVHWQDQCVVSLTVGTKSGLRHVHARQWIDATETGLLARLILPAEAWTAASPSRRLLHLYAQHVRFNTLAEQHSLEQTNWPNQRRFTVVMADNERWDQAVRRGLSQLRENLPVALADTMVSHISQQPEPVYDDRKASAFTPAPNVWCCGGAMMGQGACTLAGRFAAGVEAANRLSDLPCGQPDPGISPPPPPPQSWPSRDADVVVAGGGTAGAIAGIAAARAGARVLVFDAMSFLGGIGTGGNINSYCAGQSGGLFEEIGQSTRDLEHLFGPTQAWQAGWHHEAKKLILAQTLADAGATFVPEALLFGCHVRERTITEAHLATDAGPIRLGAQAWIDGTGDGDLCALAGAKYAMGRPGDGGLLAYSMSCGRLILRNERLVMVGINFDAGFVDPTDPEDLTRARLRGLAQYLDPGCMGERFDALTRPTHVAPLIGIRQSRHIVTDHVLSLCDLLAGAAFDDAVGEARAFLDTHGVDFEQQSDDAMFFYWVCHGFRQKLRTQMPYRMLLPRNLENTWIACRAAGIDPEAAYAVRMQRDLQRLGEAAGWAAALSLAVNGRSRAVPLDCLQERLIATGAIREADDLRPPSSAEALENLDRGEPDAALFHLISQDSAVDALRERLHSSSEDVNWLAAAVLAMRGDAVAEPRLIQAIARREGVGREGKKARGAWGQRIIVPRWLVAVCLLRRCGTSACLDALEQLVSLTPLSLNVASAVVRTLDRLGDRLTGADERKRIAGLLDRLATVNLIHTERPPSYSIDRALRDEEQHVPTNEIGADTRADFTWQLHVVLARARSRLGLPVHQTF